MYYKGYVIKDRQIPTSGHVLTDEGMESILKHQDIPLVDMIYRKIGSCKVLRDGDDIFLVAQFDYPINPFREFDVDESLGQVFFSTTYRSMDFGKEGVREIDEITVDRFIYTRLYGDIPRNRKIYEN